MDTPAVNFLTLILTTFGIVSFVVGAATAYLRLFVATKTSELRDAIQADIDDGFARKDMMDTRFDEVIRRITALEAKR